MIATFQQIPLQAVFWEILGILQSKRATQESQMTSNIQPVQNCTTSLAFSEFRHVCLWSSSQASQWTDRLILNIKSPDTKKKLKVKIIQYKKKKKV